MPFAPAGTKLWSNVMEILDEKDGVDTELLVYAMTLINKVSERTLPRPAPSSILHYLAHNMVCSSLYFLLSMSLSFKPLLSIEVKCNLRPGFLSALFDSIRCKFNLYVVIVFKCHLDENVKPVSDPKGCTVF